MTSPPPAKQQAEALLEYGFAPGFNVPGLADITRLAAQVCATPMAAVSIIGEDRQWFCATHGLGVSETPLADSFCVHAIEGKDLLLVEDAMQDARFRDSGLVQGPPHVRFYAGMPLFSRRGHGLGAVCVMDREGRTLTAEQAEVLRLLARHVEACLELRRSLRVTTGEYLQLLDRLDAGSTAIRESYETLAQVLDLLPAPVAISRRIDGGLLFVNAGARSVLGLAEGPPGSAKSTDFYENPSERARVLTLIETQGFVDGLTLRLRNAEGAVFPAILHVRPVAFAGEEALVSVIYDLTAMEAAKTAEEKANRLFRDVMGALTDAVLIVDERGKIILINDVSEKLFGYDAGALQGKAIEILVPPESRERHAALRGRFAAEPSLEGRSMGARIDLEGVRRDGTRFPLDAGLRHMATAQGNLVVCTVRDLSRQREMERTLRSTARMEAIGRLAGGVAHDFNNHLQVIRLEAAEIGVESGLQRGASDALPRLMKAVDSAASLTGQLLAFASHQVLDPVLLDVNEVTRSMGSMLERLIGEHIRVEVTLDDDLPPVHMDRSQLEQVVMNLAMNGRDAMPAGGRLRIRTATASRTPERSLAVQPEAGTGERVLISVSDEGSGMEPDVVERIFEPFFTTKEPGRGTGLGLATVYGIVRQSGGTIDVQSRRGAGSTFSVSLPALPRATSVKFGPLPRQINSGLGRAPRPASGAILVVEDDPLVRRAVCAALRREGYVVMEAGSAETAEGMVGSHGKAIRLLVSDVVLPGASGPELAERLARSVPDLRVLFMSGYPADLDLLQRLRAEGTGWIAKPFAVADLVAEVRAALDVGET